MSISSAEHHTPGHREPERDTPGRRDAAQRNILGIIALVVAIVGFIFACMPGALVVGWVLLPIAFVLALVGLLQRGKKRGSSITALIISIVGTVVGFIVFFAVVAGAFEESFGDDTSVSTPAESADADADGAADDDAGDDSGAAGTEEDDSAESADDDEAAADGEQGTRENPYPLGSQISTSDWTVTVNSVDFDADQAIAAENTFNDAAEEGFTYIMVDVTAEYTGSDPQGDTPWVSLAYVSAEGNTFDEMDSMAVVPDSFDQGSTLYEGASESGNKALIVPDEDIESGVLSVSAGLFGDTVFVAVD